MRIAFFTAGLMMSLASCTSMPDYDGPPSVEAPTAWPSESSDGTLETSGDWWQSFGNAELDSLIEEAMSASPTIEATLARIRQARAALQGSRSVLYPDVSMSANVSRTETTTEGAGSTGSWGEGLGVRASYEVDLFGSNRASVVSALSRYQQQVFTEEATALVLQSDIATGYFRVVALRQRLAAARESLEAAEHILRIVQVRRDAGAVSEFDLVRQKSEVAGIRANILSLEQEFVTAERALAVLVGQTPRTGLVAATDFSDMSLPLPAAGQPSALLIRRPDLQAAEAALRSANADIGVARAAFFPQLSLSAGATGAGLITNPATLVSSVSAALTQQIFSGGALEANVTGQQARFDELAANYRAAVLTAFSEVLDAQSRVDTGAQRVTQLRLALQGADRALEIARTQYDVGAIDLLEVLDAQRSELSARDALVQGELDRLLASVDLHSALGGSWRWNDSENNE